MPSTCLAQYAETTETPLDCHGRLEHAALPKQVTIGISRVLDRGWVVLREMRSGGHRSHCHVPQLSCTIDSRISVSVCQRIMGQSFPGDSDWNTRMYSGISGIVVC